LLPSLLKLTKWKSFSINILPSWHAYEKSRDASVIEEAQRQLVYRRRPVLAYVFKRDLLCDDDTVAHFWCLPQLIETG
jgi:hypothetical protein